MSAGPSNDFSRRDRLVEIIDRSTDLRARSRALRVSGEPLTALRDEVLEFLGTAEAAGASIISPANRSTVESEVNRWRRWLADEFGEYYAPIELAPAEISQNELYKIDYPNLMILLRQGEPISGRLVESIEFAKHLDDVREAFQESKLINCRFEKCKFDGARFGPGTKLIYVSFSECSLDYFFWPNVCASSLSFEDLKIRSAGFENGIFADVLFQNLHSDRVIFMDANFTYCKFSAAQMAGTDFSGAIFSKCMFDRSSFNACDFSDAVFSECDFIDSTIGGGSLRGALFTKCDFASLKLTKGPPRGGDSSRRMQMDTDLNSIQVKDCLNVPQMIVDHLDLQDLGQVPGELRRAEDAG